jgi:hypothetical protein
MGARVSDNQGVSRFNKPAIEKNQRQINKLRFTK